MVFPRSLFGPPLARLRVEPDQPAEGPPPITEARPRGSRRPHTDLTVAKVKHLFEQTAMGYHAIRAKTGVSIFSIMLWARDGGWQRPPDAPRAAALSGAPASQPPMETAQARHPTRGACRASCARAGRRAARRCRARDAGAASIEDGAAASAGPPRPPSPRHRRGAVGHVEARARQRDQNRAEGNASRRRRPRPRAERGGGHAARGRRASGGASGAKGEREKTEMIA